MRDVFSWVLVVLGIIGIVCIFGLSVLAINAYLLPRIKHVASGETAKRGYMECCPPGSGCNDPHAKSRHCLRLEARRIAKTEELIELERVWSNVQGVPRSAKRRRRQALDAYGAVRDGIVARALRDAADVIDTRGVQIPQHLLPSGVKGEVVGNGATASSAPQLGTPYR